MKIKIKKLHPDAIVPTQGTPCSNGYDLFSVDDAITLIPGERRAISTGISIEIPEGYTGLICPRSGNAIKKGLTVINAPGIIDSDYRGEVKGLMINHAAISTTIMKCDRIMQLVVVKAEQLEFEVIDELSTTERGEGGLGSTGN